MEYAKLSSKIERMLFTVYLHIEFVFTSEMLSVIDEHFMYQQKLFYDDTGNWPLSSFVTSPQKQTRTTFCRGYKTRILAEIAEIRYTQQLHDFRWRLIKLQRDKQKPAAAPTSAQSGNVYNGNFGAKGY
jgi:hypothetical protein